MGGSTCFYFTSSWITSEARHTCFRVFNLVFLKFGWLAGWLVGLVGLVGLVDLISWFGWFGLLVSWLVF